MRQHQFPHVLPRYAYYFSDVRKPYKIGGRFDEASAWQHSANIFQSALDSLFRCRGLADEGKRQAARLTYANHRIIASAVSQTLQ